MKTYPADMPWLIIGLKGRSFGLPTNEVRELVMKPVVEEVPDVPPWVRGVMNVRGRVIPVVDLRLRLGLGAAAAESEDFCGLMEQRKQDHLKWLAELEASVQERRDFQLTSDPHKCAFGRWYDTFKPDNVWVGSLLRRFDDPHQRVHAIAGEVLGLEAMEDWDGAIELIERTRSGVLAMMIDLFSNLQTMVRETRQEIAVVLQTPSRLIAVLVDEAIAVEKFKPENIGCLPVATQNGMIPQFGGRAGSESLVLMFETDRLLEA